MIGLILMMEAIMELDDDVSFGVIKDGWDMSQTKWSNHRRKRWIFQQTMFELPSGKLT
jgi:hypothetical protein